MYDNNVAYVRLYNHILLLQIIALDRYYIIIIQLNHYKASYEQIKHTSLVQQSLPQHNYMPDVASCFAEVTCVRHKADISLYASQALIYGTCFVALDNIRADNWQVNPPQNSLVS